MSRKDVWENYYRRWRVLSPRIKTLLQNIANNEDIKPHVDGELSENNGDDYEWSLSIRRSDAEDDLLDVALGLVDSNNASGDHDSGVRGNLNLHLVEYGGRIVGGMCPYNYTSEVWVPYRDAREFDRRMQMFEGEEDAITEAIVNWLTQESKAS